MVITYLHIIYYIVFLTLIICVKPSHAEEETQSLTSSLITGLGTMNPFQSKTQNSQMMSSQSSGSTRIQYATRKGT